MNQYGPFTIFLRGKWIVLIKEDQYNPDGNWRQFHQVHGEATQQYVVQRSIAGLERTFF